MADLQKLLKVKASTTAPQLNFLSTKQDGKKVGELSDLDEQISELLNKGEKVVLLGKHFNAQPEPMQEKTQGIPSIDRKILETGGADWKSAPEKKFPGCGLIKINNEIVIRDADQTPTVEKLGPVENWSCNNKEITVQYGEPAKDLKIKLTYDNEKAAGQYSNWTFTVTTNDKTYTPSIAVPFTQLSDKKQWRSLTCTNVTVSDSAKNSISLGPLQLQPSEESDENKMFFDLNYDCTPLMGEMMWTTVIGFFIFTFLLSVGVGFILSIEAPEKFESPRSKPLIIPDN